MSQTLTIAGVDYPIPTTGERDWSQRLNTVLAALATAVGSGESAPSSIVHFSSASVNGDEGAYHLGPWFENEAATGQRRYILIPQAGTLSQASVRVEGTAHDAECNFYLVREDNNSLHLALPASVDAVSNTEDELTVAAGERIYVQAQMALGVTVGLELPIFACVFTPS